MAKKKFDTNPLDPDFPERARQSQETIPLPRNEYKTAEFPTSNPSEEQTRRFQNQDFNAYQSPYNGQQVPTNYQPHGLYDVGHTSNRKVAGIGLPENILTALPYIPWYIGMVASLIILFVVPKSEAKVRFHAAQGLAAHLAILIISAVLGGLGKVTDIASIGNGIFQIVTMVMLIIFAIKAWQSKPVHIESVDDLTNWLEEKISPKA